MPHFVYHNIGEIINERLSLICW